MQTVRDLIVELQKFPPDARCHAYEGEGLLCDDGRIVNSYIVIGSARRVEFANGGIGYTGLGCVPCSDEDHPDGPAVIDA